MAKYLIERTLVAETEIEANSEEEAIEIARDLDISEFDILESMTESVFELSEEGNIVA